MQNKMQDLRNKLFQVLENLTDPEQPLTKIDVEAAKRACEIGKLILETGRAELQHAQTIEKYDMHSVPFFEQNPSKAQKLIS